MNDAEKAVIAQELVSLSESLAQLWQAARAERQAIEELDGWVKEIDQRLRNLDRAFRRLAQYVGGEALAEPHGRES
jgi:hypothetical protein